MDTEEILKEIRNTGFPLEYEISNILKNHGWQTINNRYYIDDTKGIEREIDILAYKCKIDKTNKIAFYTTLIISCKKSKEGIWTFLRVDKPVSDPNFKYFVTANKTSDKRLSKMLDLNSSKIEEKFCTERELNVIFNIERQIFAFQQINGKSKKCEDDKRIYDSIITCIKALDYEMNIRPDKSIIEGVSTAFYNFNLISIFDGEMLEAYFQNENIDINDMANAIYINRHIINRKENFYKVHFIKSDYFETYLSSYDIFNDYNYIVYQSLIDDFYKNIFDCKEKVDVFWKDFTDSINWIFNYTVHHELNCESEQRTEEFGFSYDFNYDLKILFIYYNGYWDTHETEMCKKINENRPLMEKTQKELFNYFRYNGDFLFEEEPLPF